jgi:hypothetical protein
MGLLSALVLLAAPVVPELELQIGYAHGTDLQLDGGALALGARLGIDLFAHFTVSARIARAAGNDVPEAGNPTTEAAFSGWQALGELRAHTAGELQLHAAVAAGVAQLNSWKPALGETQSLTGDPAFAYQFSAGVRIVPENWRTIALSLEATLAHWDGLRPPTNPGTFQQSPDPVTTFSFLAGLVFKIR